MEPPRINMLETLDRTTGHTDQEVLSLLLRRYEMQLESTTHLVADRLEEAGIFPGDVRDLVYRHGLLFFAALEALGCELDGQERIACGAILAYSIPLVWIDSNLDGNVSGLRQHELPWSLVGKPRTVSLLTHLGYQDIAVDSRSNVSIQWISKIALAVIDAMSLDFTRRWNLKQFEADQAAISRYWESPTSRLNGSGIGSLMIGLASIQADGRVTAERAEIASILGRLRQVADELMDVDEDIREGLITLPVLYGLNNERCRDFFHRMVRKLWMDSSFLYRRLLRKTWSSS